MTFYYSQDSDAVTAWIEHNGVDVYEASGGSLETALGNLVYALSQRDDPKATPIIRVVEKKKPS